MAYYSPLRYPGGKRKLSKYVENLIQINELEYGTYVEPFAGGAAIALYLLFQEMASDIVINDIDFGIYSFWKSILNNTEEFCEHIKETEVTLEEWENQKEIQKNMSSHTTFEVGFSTFFLNRTNRSGIISGGPIGGRKQKGKWKIDVRFNKEELIKRIKMIGLYADRIKVYNLDASKFIQKYISKMDEKTLIYIDPPYYQKGPELYMNYYSHEDHTKLSKVITEEIKHPWVLTYDDVPEINNLYKDYINKKIYITYTAARKVKGKEIMIFSNNLKIPNS